MKLLAAVLVATLAAHAQQTGFLNRTVSVDGKVLRYQVYVPQDYTPARSWPVLLSLHGAGGRGSDGLLQTDTGLGHAIRQHPERFPAIVVFPQSPLDAVPGWQAYDGRIALATLDAAEAEFKTDRTRTYLTGQSMGGNGAWFLSYRHPERFVAMIVVCGFVQERTGTSGQPYKAVAPGPDLYQSVASRIAKMPIRIFHNSEDPQVPVEESRKMFSALKAVGADVEYTEFPIKSHNARDPTYEKAELWSWLFQQRRK